MAAKVFKLGPGTLKLGPTATALDISCQLTNAILTPDKDTEDPVTVLCGDTIPGASTYQWKITGTALVDLTEGGMVQYTWANQNKVAAFEFVPNTDVGTSFTGEVIIDPLAVGGDSGKNMSQDFEWDCVGTPVPVFPDAQSATYPAVFTIPNTSTYPTPVAAADDSTTPVTPFTPTGGSD